MTQVNGKLKHGESVFDKFIPEISIYFPIFFCFGRQVEKNQYPHNSVFAKPLHLNNVECKIEFKMKNE